MKGMSKREGRRQNKGKSDEFEGGAGKREFHQNQNQQQPHRHAKHHQKQQQQDQQPEKAQINARSSDPRDQAALKALAAQRNRKGGRSTLLGGAGGVGAKNKNTDALLNSFKSRLSGSTFRLMNEQLYTTPSDFAKQLLSNDAAFKEYHDGYNRQLALWPVNPVDIIIDSLKYSKKGRFDVAFNNIQQLQNNKNLNNNAEKWNGIPSNIVVADFGCGSAHLAKVMKKQFNCTNTIHSLDLCNKEDPEWVTACDMSETPLEDSSVDIAIFSLSLMSVNWTEYLIEAHRTLKKGKVTQNPNEKQQQQQNNNNNQQNTSSSTGGGLLKIIEVRSRLPDPDQFVQLVESLGFKFVWGDVVGEGYFCAFDFEAVERPTKRDVQAERALPNANEVLTPCLYKRR